jgi:anti-sigma-K factor RskA
VSTSLTQPGSDAPPSAINGAGPDTSFPEQNAEPRVCAKCGSSLQEGQDWCLQCGASTPGSLRGGGPGWRTGIAILGATAVLVCGAAVAAYAALNKTKPKPAVLALVAKTPTTSVTPTPTPTTPGATPTPGTPTTVKAAPKIPLQTTTPKSSSGESAGLFPPESKTTSTPKTTTPTKTTEESNKAASEKPSGEGSETKTGEEAPSPILLDTNAASVYNPYSFPASLFGDPSLAIDGEVKTAWTAQVQASVAPKMAEGLVLDLNSPQKLGSATVITTTTGVTVEIYGANGTTLPTTISSPEWARLVGLKVLKKKTTPLKLKTKGKGYRYVLLWLAKAPAGSTAANPGTVSVNELELFPPSS